MKYFHLEEMIRTSTGLPNFPDEEQLDNLIELIEKVLDPAREKLNKAIIVTSGFRSSAVNRKVGGVASSQHCTGQAADVKTTNNRYNRYLFELLKEGEYDQLIWEFGDSTKPAWVHVSYRKDGRNRHQALRAVKVNGRTVYKTIS